MDIFTDYAARMESSSEVRKESQVEKGRNKLIRQFWTCPSAEKLRCLEPDSPKAKWVRIRLIHDSAVKQTNPERRYSRSIVVHPEDTIAQGSILYGIDGKDWIVSDLTNMGGIHQQGAIYRINKTLKWMHEGQVLSSPAVVFPTSYNATGIVETQQITVPVETTKAMVPLNAQTKTLQRDMRFIISGTSYKITRIMDYLRDSVLDINMKETQIQANDNLELEIADYVETAADPAPHISGANEITFSTVREFTVENVGDDIIDYFTLADSSHVDVISTSIDSIKLKLLSSAVVGTTLDFEVGLASGAVLTKSVMIRSLL